MVSFPIAKVDSRWAVGCGRCGGKAIRFGTFKSPIRGHCEVVVMALCRKSHLNIWACHLRNLDITLLPLLCVVSVPITLPNGSFGSRFEIPFWVPTASLVPVE